MPLCAPQPRAMMQVNPGKIGKSSGTLNVQDQVRRGSCWERSSLVNNSRSVLKSFTGSTGCWLFDPLFVNIYVGLVRGRSPRATRLPCTQVLYLFKQRRRRKSKPVSCQPSSPTHSCCDLPGFAKYHFHETIAYRGSRGYSITSPGDLVFGRWSCSVQYLCCTRLW